MGLEAQLEHTLMQKAGFEWKKQHDHFFSIYQPSYGKVWY